MIDTGSRGRIFVHRKAVDMRKHFDTLWGVVTEMGHDVLAGDVFVFVGKNRTRAKIFWWDGTGVCVLCKRMSKGRFFAPWQHQGDGPVELSRTELSLLVEGSELVGKVRLHPETWARGTP